jgi:hypothetical protein
MESEFGNASWHGYVTASYLVVLLGLIMFGFFAFRSSKKSIACLKDEGYLKD